VLAFAHPVSLALNLRVGDETGERYRNSFHIKPEIAFTLAELVQ